MLFKVNVVLFTFDALAGGIIALWKSVVITVKVEIGGAAAQIVLREVADKRRLYREFLHYSSYTVVSSTKHSTGPVHVTSWFFIVLSYQARSNCSLTLFQR